MNHEQYELLMSAALDGESTAEERRELELHLAVCPECADLWKRLCAQSAALRAMDCQLPDGLKERIMSQLPARKPRRSPWKRWAAACACLVIAVGAVFAGSRIWQAGSAAPGSSADSPAGGSSPQAYPSENGWEGVADGTLKLGPQFDQCPAYAFSSAASFCYRVDTALPDSVCILDSTESLDTFLSQLQLSSSSDPDSGEDTWASQLSQLYDADYFSSGRLAAIVIKEAAGTPQLLDLTAAEVQVSLSRFPEDERADWLILATVDGSFSAQDDPTLTLIEADNS